MKLKNLLGKELRNSGELVKHAPGMELVNSNGDINPASLGYQYTIQTTTQIRAQVVKQKFYEVPMADFIPVIPGTGAWMEDIKTNLVYDLAGSFEAGIIGVASGPSQIAEVDTGTSPVSARVVTWAKGYRYTTPEIQKALAANNWDVVASKMESLKKHWDLGLQQVSFLGLLSDLGNVPGLLTSGSVNSNLSVITGNISQMSSQDFQTFVATILDAYFENSNGTVLPDTFVIPMKDYLGLAAAASPDFPVNSKISYLLNAFREITQNPNFQIKGLAYADQARNAGYTAPGGLNRYALYRKDPETLKLDLPVDFQLTPAGTANNFQWQGVGVAQFTGTVFYRPAECLYFDWSV